MEFNQLEDVKPHIMTYSKIAPVLWKESEIRYLSGLGITVQYDSYSSFDKIQVPLTIIRKNGNDGSKKPCLVYAIGGFGDCLLKRFDLYFLLFVEFFNGVVGSYRTIKLLFVLF